MNILAVRVVPYQPSGRINRAVQIAAMTVEPNECLQPGLADVRAGLTGGVCPFTFYTSKEAAAPGADRRLKSCHIKIEVECLVPFQG